MKAVILAGGEGTRLRPLTYTRIKPMVPFLNRPIIEHIVARLSRQGFREVIITTNVKGKEMEEHLGDGSKWGLDLRIIHEHEPLGTAGSVKNAVDGIDDAFAVIQGDNISEIDIAGLYREHRRMGGLLTISLIEVDDVSLFGIAEMDGYDIVRYKEKPRHDETFSNLANDGIYILEPEVLDMIPLQFYDFSKNLFPRMLEKGKRICGSVTHAFWRDVGTPKDYLEATHYLLHEKNIIGEGSVIDGSTIMESVLGSGCTVANASITSSVVFDNTKIGRGSKLKNCIVGSNCILGEDVDIWPGAVIGDEVVIEKGATIQGNARIGPRVTIKAGSTVDEVVLPEDLR